MRKFIRACASSALDLTCIGLARGWPLMRYSMYRSLQEDLRGVDLGHDVLAISHSAPLGELLGVGRPHIVEANYPEQAIDALSYPDNSFSAVVSDQVLEHVSCTPSQAVDEVHRVLRPGGIAIHTTCFMTPYHGADDHTDLSNGDFWRFTPSGLARLHMGYSQVLAAKGWGNPLLPILGGLGLLRARVPEARWHPFNMIARANRPSYAATVWVVAQK